MKLSRILIAGIATMSMVALGACSQNGGASTDAASGTTESGSSAAKKIGYVPTTMNNPFWQAIYEGLEESVAGDDVEIVTVDPQNDQAKMNDMVGDLISAGVDVIVLAPYDTTGVQAGLEAAEAAGIPVVNIDTPVTAQNLVATVVASDNEKAGRLVAEGMMEDLPKGSEVAVLHCPAGQACIDRLSGFTEAAGDYFTIVQELDGKGELATGMTLSEDILQSNPNVKGIFGVNDPMALGAVQALQAHSEIEGVKVYGVDGSPDGKRAIKDGLLAGTGAQSPSTIGKEAGAAALLLMSGGTPEKEIVIDTMMINSANVDEYGTDTWQ